MRFITLIIFLSFCNITWGQSEKFNKKIHKKIEKLQNKNIDTIGVYTIHGEYMITPKCGPTLTYIFWKEQSKTKIIKVDECKTSKPKTLLNTNLFDFYYTNQNVINKEVLKAFFTKDGKLISTSHYIKNTITIHNNKETKTWVMKNFNLSKNSGEHVNINYDKNNNLILIEWKKMIEKKLKEMNHLFN